MTDPLADPWLIELIVVRGSHTNRERAALSRDARRRLVARLREGVYVERVAFEAMSPEAQHIVRMRALAAVNDRPTVFSHSSAAVGQRLPVLREGLGAVHTTVTSRNERGRTGVVGHLLPLRDDEVHSVGGLLMTTPARTVVDVASAAAFVEGVAVADALLRSGSARADLEETLGSLPPRQGLRRAEDVVAFAHPGAESAAESHTRVTLLRIGIEPPVLQHPLVLQDGSRVFLDTFFPTFEVGGEVDGAIKLLDPAMSKDARLALLKEKRREDAVRLLLRGLARWGWVEAQSAPRLAAVLRAVGVHPAESRPTLADYAAAARDARPRFVARSPPVRR